ncbi:MAG: GNAT family N-acetyltransferase [Actinomycetota bacterium]
MCPANLDEPDLIPGTSTLALVLGIRVDEDVFLRLHEERHAEDLFRLTDDNRDHLRPWMPWVYGTTSPDDTRRFLREVLQKLAAGREYGFAVLDRGRLVGAMGLRVAEDTHETEVGYWLSAEAQGRGIITRATQALVRFSFEELGMDRVVILCASDNVRSRAVPERLGFTLEGTLRRRDLVPGREPRDQIVYSLLRSEWEESTS